MLNLILIFGLKFRKSVYLFDIKISNLSVLNLKYFQIYIENISLAQTYESRCDQKKILHSLVEFKSQDMNIFIEVGHSYPFNKG